MSAPATHLPVGTGETRRQSAVEVLSALPRVSAHPYQSSTHYLTLESFNENMSQTLGAQRFPPKLAWMRGLIGRARSQFPHLSPRDICSRKIGNPQNRKTGDILLTQSRFQTCRQPVCPLRSRPKPSASLFNASSSHQGCGKVEGKRNQGRKKSLTTDRGNPANDRYDKTVGPQVRSNRDVLSVKRRKEMVPTSSEKLSERHSESLLELPSPKDHRNSFS